MHWRLLATLSFISVIVFRFILKSLIHLDLSFVHGARYLSIFILPHVAIQLCQHYLLKMLFSPLYNFSFLDKNQVLICVCISICVSDLISVVNVSVFMPIPSCFHYCFSVMEVDGLCSLRKFLSYTGLFWVSVVFSFSILSWLLLFLHHIFCLCPPCFLLYAHMVIFFHFIYMMDYINRFLMLYHSCISLMKLTW